MYEQRLEQVLIRLAKDHAPVVIEDWPTLKTEDNALGKLARRLANYNILVITGEMTSSFQHITEDTTRLLQEWVNTYGELYTTLVGTVFPHQIPHISGHYTDSLWPVIIYLRGSITPVIQTMAGYIMPYIAVRQTAALLSRAELIGLIDMVLANLEGDDISPEARKHLHENGTRLLDTLINGQMRQYPLMPPAPDLFTDSLRMRPITVEQTSPRPAGSSPEPPRPPVDDLLSDSHPIKPVVPPSEPPRPPDFPGMSNKSPGTAPFSSDEWPPLPPDDLPSARAVGGSNGDTEQLSATNRIPPAPAEVETPEEQDDSLPKPLGSEMPLFFRRRKKDDQNDSKQEKSRRHWLPRHQYGEEDGEE